jgi:cytoskeleton protein RodZ
MFTPVQELRSGMASTGIGERLRSAREALGLSLEEIENVTRIRRSFLVALEQESFDVLPGPAYARGFLRTYARYLGIPSEELLDLYPSPSIGARSSANLHLESSVEVRITPAARLSPARRVLVGAGILVGLAVLVLGVVLYGQIRQFAETPASSPGPPAPQAGPARPSATPPSRSLSTAPPAPPHASVVLPAPAKNTGPAAPQPAPAPTRPQPPSSPLSQTLSVVPGTSPKPPAAPGPGAAPGAVPTVPPPAPAKGPASTPAPGAPPATGKAPASGPAPPVPPAPPLNVTVTASAYSWVRTVADGATVFEGFVNAGDKQVWAAKRTLTVKVGNASAVDISLNGKSLGRLGAAGEVYEHTFSTGPATP